MKKGRVSSLVPMAAAAPRAATIADILRTKSNIASPLFHPAGLGARAAATIAGAFPLKEEERAADSGTSIVVESPLFIFFKIYSVRYEGQAL